MTDLIAPTTPLASAEVESLDELFALDPLKLTDNQVGHIVTELRRQRSNWAQEETQAQLTGKKPNPKAVKAAAPKQQALDIKVDDLSLDL